VPAAVLPFIAAQIGGALAATYLCRWLFAENSLLPPR
jgi:glycerol uptake facilitator-like aquaporin